MIKFLDMAFSGRRKVYRIEASLPADRRRCEPKGGKPGGNAGGNRGGKAPKADKPMDPNSPFAVLAQLKK